MSGTSGPGSIVSQRERVHTSLANLKNLISLIPNTAPEGDPNGPLVRNFSDLDVDSEDGPYAALDRAWVRTFQVPPEQQEQLITRGKYGVEHVYQCLAWFASLPTMEANNGLFLLAERIDSLNRLVARIAYQVYKQNGGAFTDGIASTRAPSALPNTSPAPPKPKASSLGKRKVRKDTDSEAEAASDASTRPLVQTAKAQKHSTDTPQPSNTKGRKKSQTDTAKNPKPTKHSRKKRITEEIEDDAGNQSDASAGANDDDEPLRRGRRPRKQTWALSYFVPLRYSANGKSLWKWQCNFCSTYRTSPRTDNCKSFDQEVPALRHPPYPSNYIRHLEKECKKIPKDCSFAAWEARQSGAEVAAGTGRDGDAHGVVVGASSRAREVMSDFVERGRINPEKQVTRKGFREHFVKGVIEDDLPYAFGSGIGMSRCFEYILPKGYKVPDRWMVRRDLNLLHEAISEKLNRLIQENTSKISVGSDTWTSKSSVFAFSGLAAYWITADWKLVDYPLELLPLDGDHTGAHAAKLLHHALERRRASKKLLGSTADNASSNDKMNRVLVQRIARESGVHLDPDDIQIGCTGHVTHLSVQDFLHALGLAPDPEVEDLYEESRRYPLAFNPEQDDDVMEHSATAAKELEQEDTADNGEDDESAISGSDTEEEASGDDDDGEDNQTTAQPGKAKKPKRVFTAVDKLHAVVVDILRSEVRRKRMRRYTRQLCSKETRHLVPVRSMPVRWNTTYAEIERGLQLRPAINQWIEQLDSGLTGRKATAARAKKRKWHLSPQDWETLSTICTILKPFNDVTHQLSRRGVPTIPMVLPLLKYLQQHLTATKATLKSPGEAQLRLACTAAYDKLEKYIQKAFVSKYPLLGAVLHPYIRIAYFHNKKLWDSTVPSRARALLQELYDEYAERLGVSSSQARSASDQEAKPTSSSVFAAAVAVAQDDPSTSEEGSEQLSEIDRYLNNAYPCKNESGALEWWQQHASEFPVLSAIARDVLAIPGVSIGIERLFSSCRRTLSDIRSSLTAESAALTIITKEWLKRGLGDDIFYLDGVTIHE